MPDAVSNPLCKLFLISYAAHISNDYNQSSMAGGTWIEVGNFSLEKCRLFASKVETHGEPPGPGQTKISVQAVWIPISTDP
jgi:hypothetical protein